MLGLSWRGPVALMCVATLSVMSLEAQAAKKAAKPKKEEPVHAPAPPPPQAAAPAPAPLDPRTTNSPSPYGSGYAAWGTRGGATLGQGGKALRVSLFGGNHFFGDGYGYGGMEATFLFSAGDKFDIGPALRLSLIGIRTPPAVAPGFELRWRWVDSGPFHLALSAAGFVPLSFGGYFGGVTIGGHLEPGILASYFFRDNIELMFGVLVPLTLHVISFSIPVFQWGVSGRLGFAYTFKKTDLGLYFFHDIAPGFYTVGGFPRATTTLAGARAEAAFMVAFNFHLGLQVKL